MSREREADRINTIDAYMAFFANLVELGRHDLGGYIALLIMRTRADGDTVHMHNVRFFKKKGDMELYIDATVWCAEGTARAFFNEVPTLFAHALLMGYDMTAPGMDLYARYTRERRP